MKQAQRRPRLRTAAGISLGIVFVLLVGSAAILWNPVRSIASLRKVDDYPLYTMTYYGGYSFDHYLKHGIEKGIYETIYQNLYDMNYPVGCTTFVGLNTRGDIVLGRNFDWKPHAALLLFTDPPDGFASASMVDIHYLGFRMGQPSWMDRLRLLASPYVTVDGVNEHGLAVSEMAVHGMATPCRIESQGPDRATIINNHIMRLVLDYARDVDEALELIRDYDVHFPETCTHHLLADASGSAAVVEYVGGEVVVTRNWEPWQVSSNFLIWEEAHRRGDAPCWRYSAAYGALKEAEGSITQREAMDIAREVSTVDTVWSAVYSLTSGRIQVVMGRNYEQVHEFRLEERDR